MMANSIKKIKTFSKITAFAVVLALILPSAVAADTNIADPPSGDPGVTWQEFYDIENSSADTFTAGTLAFTPLEARDVSTCDPNTEICPAGDVNYNIILAQAGSLDFNYSVTITNATSSLCAALTVNGKAVNGYDSGPLLHSASPNFNLSFHLTSNDTALQNQICDFDYVIRAWQTNLSHGGAGFSDQQIIHSSITSDPWIMETEIQAMPVTANFSDQIDEAAPVITEAVAPALTPAAEDTAFLPAASASDGTDANTSGVDQSAPQTSNPGDNTPIQPQLINETDAGQSSDASAAAISDNAISGAGTGSASSDNE